MERAEWLKKVRTQAEKLYDHGAPAYWVIWGMSIDETHRQFIDKYLDDTWLKIYRHIIPMEVDEFEFYRKRSR